AETFGILLGAFGVGAVTGALGAASVRARLSNEGVIRVAAALVGIASVGVAASRVLPLTLVCLWLAGIGWMQLMTTFNVAVQLAAPRWVAGRALAAYQSAVAAGVAIGSWGWGHVAVSFGVDGALYGS